MTRPNHLRPVHVPRCTHSRPTRLERCIGDALTLVALVIVLAVGGAAFVVLTLPALPVQVPVERVGK